VTGREDAKDERRFIPGGRSDRDLLAALASGFVAVLALASSIYNVYLQRQQVKAQVYPRLSFGVTWTGEDWAFVVKNNGSGPADIQSAHLRVDGHPVTSWYAAEKALVRGGPTSIGVTGSTLTMVSAGDKIHPFSVSDPSISRVMFNERNRLRVELCYCSTLGDCWTVSGQGVESDPPVSSPPCVAEPGAFKVFDEEALDEYMRSLMDGGLTPRDAAAD
jgi:hypothetical protein